MYDNDNVAKTVLTWIMIIAVVSAIGFLTKIAFFPAHVANKGIDTAYGVVDKTLNADNAIYNYEWFKTQYESYNSINKKIENAKKAVSDFEKSAGSRDKWTFEDKNEHARLSSIVTGLEAQNADIVAEYNAKSKMANRSLFKDKNLPEQLQ
jgi:hypothetical protein